MSAVVLDGYQIGAVLGEGGSGTVYAATRDEDHREVAIKVLRADLTLTDGEVKRFLAEAGLMERITHAAIVPVLAHGQLADGRPYLVMPRLVGETLATARSKLSATAALALFSQLADAVATLHAAGIIHRDLKPENIFVVAGTQIVLLDFGIAKDAESGPGTTTTEGGVRGTPAYMAPERFFGAAASVRSDLYELAVTLYEMLVGALPWVNPEDIEARLDPKSGGLSAPLWEELRLALSSNPSMRPASATAFREAIEAAGSTNGALGAPHTATIRSKSLGTAETVRAQTTERPSAHAIQTAERPLAPRRAWRSLSIGAGAVVVAGIVTAVVVMRPSKHEQAASVSAAARSTFCASLSPKAGFCADFEGPGDFRAGFFNEGKTPEPGETGGGTIKLSLAREGFPSKSLELAGPALVSAANKASAMLTAELPAPVHYTVITFMLRIDTEMFSDDKALAMLMSLDFGKPGAIVISRRQTGLQLSVYDDKSNTKAPFESPLPVGTWKQVKLVVHNYAVTPDGRGDVVVFLDGLAAKLPLPASLHDIKPRLNIGIVASRGPMQPLRINIDDLAVTSYEGPDPVTN